METMICKPWRKGWLARIDTAVARESGPQMNYRCQNMLNNETRAEGLGDETNHSDQLQA